MTARVILRGAELMLCAERAEESPDAAYGAECLTCQAESAWFEDDPRPVQVWALDHTERQGLTHNQFRVIAHNYWRVDPRSAPVGAAPWPPINSSPAVPEAPPPRRSGAHAKPRGRRLGRRNARKWLRPLAAVASHAAGPLVLLCALVVGSLLLGVTETRPGRAIEPVSDGGAAGTPRALADSRSYGHHRRLMPQAGATVASPVPAAAARRRLSYVTKAVSSARSSSAVARWIASRERRCGSV